MRTRSLGRRPQPPPDRFVRDLTVTELFSGFALMGFLSSQGGIADKRMACRWASTMGTLLARETTDLKRRRPGRRKPRRSPPDDKR